MATSHPDGGQRTRPAKHVGETGDNYVPLTVNPVTGALLTEVPAGAASSSVDVTDRAGRVLGNVAVSNFPATTEITNDVGNPIPVSGSVSVGNFPATQPVSGTVALDAPSLAALESTTVAVSNLSQVLDAGNTTTITNTAATFTGAWKVTRSLGLVEQQTVFASNVASGLGATVTFQYSEDGVNPTVSEVRAIASFSSVRNLELENFGEFYRVIVTPSRALTPAEFIFVTTQHNRLPGGHFVRLADQVTERGFASMPRTFAYLKGFNPLTGLDANVAVNAAGTLATEEILSFQTVSLAGKGYNVAAFLPTTLTTEFDLLLFKNTSAAAGTLVRLYEQVVAIPDSAANTRSVIRVYRNPTITTNGTALTIAGLRTGQAATVAQAFSSPTISARGTLVQIYGVTNSPVVREINLSRYVEPGDSILFTCTPSSVGVNHSFSQAWAEVAWTAIA